MNNDLYAIPCSDQVCAKKFHLTKAFDSLEQVEKQLIVCQECQKVENSDTIAQSTYRNISVLWAERHNLQVGRS